MKKPYCRVKIGFIITLFPVFGMVLTQIETFNGPNYYLYDIVSKNISMIYDKMSQKSISISNLLI